MKEHTKYKVSSESFTIDTAKLWNKADPSIKAGRNIGICQKTYKKIL